MDMDHHPSPSPHPSTPNTTTSSQHPYSRHHPPPPPPPGTTFVNPGPSASISPHMHVDRHGFLHDHPLRSAGGAPRPKGVHTKHLTELERFRVRTLYYDACLTKRRIQDITGYSESQIRTAVRAKTAAPGKRPGRPRKNGGKGPVTHGEPANEAEANAMLVLQAQQFFAEQNGHDDEDGDEDEDGEGEDELPSPYPGVNAGIRRNIHTAPNHYAPSTPISPFQSHHHPPHPQQHQGFPPPPITSASASSSAWPPTAPVIRKSIPDLPSDIRLQIWRAVMQFLPTQSPHARSWAVSVRSSPPYLELGTASPPAVQLLPNPPWANYVELRHVPAMALARTNREARGVVLERLTPVVVSHEIGGGRQGIPAFVWIDRVCDFVHFDRGVEAGVLTTDEGDDGEVGEQEAAELFEKAGKVAFPEVYR